MHRRPPARPAFRALAGWAALLILSGCGGRSPETRPPDSAPKRIISCAPNLTEMIFALGAGDRLIGVTRFCRYPPEARSIPPLGDLFQPNLEAMVAARPDLIVLVPGNRKILDFFAGKPETKLLETNACETVADIQATIRQLGTALGAAPRAESMVKSMESGLDSVRREFAGAPPVRYLLVIGHDPDVLEQIYVAGRTTYLTELAALSGGENVVPSDLGRYPIVSREALVALNPDVIVERHLGGPAGGAERRRIIALWQELPTLAAVRHNRIVILDDDHVTIPGPDLVRSARVMAGLLHSGAGHE